MKAAIIVSTVLGATAWAQDTFTNPLVYQDLPDLEVFRVGDAFYYSAGTMHLSPGATIMKSYDLVNWEMVGHSVPELAFGDDYYMNTTRTAYVGGIWASTLRYRESNGVFYWYGCIDFAQTHIFTASDPAGPWTQHPPLPDCYYDVGLLVDDDDTMYLAYGRYDINVVQLSEDGFSAVRDENVWSDQQTYLEGARFYHINNRYYIWLTRPADGQFVLVSDSPFGPYTRHEILNRMASPIPNAGTPHQGGIVDTPQGDWYYIGFLDAYPAGRMPVMAPLEWDSSGIPRIVTDSSGGWGLTYPVPAIEPAGTVVPTGEFSDDFGGAALHPEWQWNHNPDNSAWALGGEGLVLSTATVTDSLVLARNTLTHRVLGPKSGATFRINVGGMQDGDVSGVAILRDESSFIGLRKSGDSLALFTHHGIVLTEANDWQLTERGQEVATADVELGDVASGAQDIWLRIVADVHPTFGTSNNNNPATFHYSTDGETFTELGPALALHNRWQFFVAFRFGVFNFATTSLGGSIVVKEFDLQLVD
ncbi:family 43 glycosyl hydrolase [Stachybotrys elegans]|uniref:Family 43 glycosyl hydrolase n=1 Tax=Stachybotrys elegans TaxID=80388 RepID=A0A8K0SWK1_9HYPO|nr:family 43 glycosyl hydrolase [Stachybotrys elegans]